jgi:hypothetical protein
MNLLGIFLATDVWKLNKTPAVWSQRPPTLKKYWMLEVYYTAWVRGTCYLVYRTSSWRDCVAGTEVPSSAPDLIKLQSCTTKQFHQVPMETALTYMSEGFPYQINEDELLQQWKQFTWARHNFFIDATSHSAMNFSLIFVPPKKTKACSAVLFVYTVSPVEFGTKTQIFINAMPLEPIHFVLAQ